MRLKTFSTTFIFLLAATSFAQVSQLQKDIDKIVKNKKATVGVSIIGNNVNDTVNINPSKHFPLQSVFKFHIAIAVLSEVDKGNLQLDQKIVVDKKDLLKDTWSPMRDQYPDGATLSLAQILEYTLIQSDNNGCDILLRLLNGPKFVEDYFIKNNFTDIAIKATEEDMHKDWETQFSNWTTPKSASDVLIAYYNNPELLSKGSYDFLWTTMKATQVGAKRIKGQLPSTTIVAHRTGTSGSYKGITAAVNDIGVILLPNGKHFYISVFVSNSKEDEKTNEKIISDIAKAAYNYFNKQ
ncbi:class A beta-lactamase, subclass A2 [Flavobacterium subsaxonicum]|uniref:beta-lactamase n=1 Tax=Flavobacterium subsaxonicum WB 4.1-42 = DSM 21790 TaxID=1121898 RepID=A0A0A2MIS9_9FLAO|nr:class A beta-lactamase, subclass A2 [Flavobacterium subsaxonicum]KGO91398.1 beta-lactamase [Flavobacterium subsaxonicum WB 4.1-42 = DSM 21790]